MKLKSILTLVLAAMILVVMGTGNAFAASWSGTDKSYQYAIHSADWTEVITQRPVFGINEIATWANSFRVDSSAGSAAYSTMMQYMQDGNGLITTNGPTLYYYSQPWTPTGSITTMWGTHDITVDHYYRYQYLNGCTIHQYYQA